MLKIQNIENLLPGDLVVEHYSDVSFYYLVEKVMDTKIYTYFCIRTYKKDKLISLSHKDIFDLFSFVPELKIFRTKDSI